MEDYLSEKANQYSGGKRAWRIFWQLLFAYAFVEITLTEDNTIFNNVMYVVSAVLLIWRAGVNTLNKVRASQARNMDNLLRHFAKPVCTGEELKTITGKANTPHKLRTLITTGFIRRIKYDVAGDRFLLRKEDEPPVARRMRVQCPSCGAACEAVERETRYCEYCGAPIHYSEKETIPHGADQPGRKRKK